jgi:hypothetical protein
VEQVPICSTNICFGLCVRLTFSSLNVYLLFILTLLFDCSWPLKYTRSVQLSAPLQVLPQLPPGPPSATPPTPHVPLLPGSPSAIVASPSASPPPPVPNREPLKLPSPPSSDSILAFSVFLYFFYSSSSHQLTVHQRLSI